MDKKIVIFSAFLTPFRSGAEACAEEIPLELKDHFNFVIITAKLRSSLPRHDKLKGVIPVVRVGLGLPIDKWLYPFLAPFAAKKFNPDIVHAVLETFAGLALLLSRFTLPKAKRILTLQTTNRSFLKSAIIRSAHKVTAISSVLVAAAKRAGKKAELIPNGISLRAIQDAADWNKKVSGRVLFVGRLEKMKGVDTLLKAFAEISLESTLHIVGDGSQRKVLEQLTEELKLSSRVTFLGHLSATKLHDEYAEAEIFCGLSRSEALGNVFLEAQAAACAVVATNVGGIPEIVSDGILVEPEDVHGAANAIQKLLDDTALRHLFAMNGKKHAMDFDWSSIARHYANLYQSFHHQK